MSGKLGGNLLEPNCVKFQSDYEGPTGLIPHTSVLQIFLLRSFSVLFFSRKSVQLREQKTHSDMMEWDLNPKCWLIPKALCLKQLHVFLSQSELSGLLVKMKHVLCFFHEVLLLNQRKQGSNISG